MEKEKEVKVDNKEKLILKQVSLKAASNLGGTKEEVVDNASFFNDWLLEGLDQDKKPVTPTSFSSNDFKPICPCPEKSEVWDNRKTAKNGQPLFRCKNENCENGNFSKKFNKIMPWASWDPDEFYNLEVQFNKQNNRVEDKAIDEEIVENTMTDDAKNEAPF